MIRIFGGKKYELHGSYAKRANAKRKAFSLAIGRAGPCLIKQESGYWVVYVRVAKKK